MAKNQDLYISVDFEQYKKNKLDILNSQADLLSIMRHLENLKQIKSQKNNFKIYLHKLISETISCLESLEGKMPKPKIPKFLEKKKNQKYTKEIGEEMPKKYNSRYREIDAELREIQGKLKALNG